MVSASNTMNGFVVRTVVPSPLEQFFAEVFTRGVAVDEPAQRRAADALAAAGPLDPADVEWLRLSLRAFQKQLAPATVEHARRVLARNLQGPVSPKVQIQLAQVYVTQLSEALASAERARTICRAAMNARLAGDPSTADLLTPKLVTQLEATLDSLRSASRIGRQIVDPAIVPQRREDDRDEYLDLRLSVPIERAERALGAASSALLITSSAIPLLIEDLKRLSELD